MWGARKLCVTSKSCRLIFLFLFCANQLASHFPSIWLMTWGFSKNFANYHCDLSRLETIIEVETVMPGLWTLPDKLKSYSSASHLDTYFFHAKASSARNWKTFSIKLPANLQTKTKFIQVSSELKKNSLKTLSVFSNDPSTFHKPQMVENHLPKRFTTLRENMKIIQRKFKGKKTIKITNERIEV